MISFSERDGFLIFTVRVIPRASQSEVVGEHDCSLKVRLAAPPVDGAANEELIKTLAKAFGVSKASVEIVSGQTSKTKKVRIEGAKSETLMQLA